MLGTRYIHPDMFWFGFLWCILYIVDVLVDIIGHNYLTCLRTIIQCFWSHLCDVLDATILFIWHMLFGSYRVKKERRKTRTCSDSSGESGDRWHTILCSRIHDTRCSRTCSFSQYCLAMRLTHSWTPFPAKHGCDCGGDWCGCRRPSGRSVSNAVWNRHVIVYRNAAWDGAGVYSFYCNDPGNYPSYRRLSGKISLWTSFYLLAAVKSRSHVRRLMVLGQNICKSKMIYS